MDWGLRLLWPSRCVVCLSAPTAAGNPYICTPCWEQMPRLTAPWCPRCGRPFASGFALSHSPDHWCAACRDREPYFDRARAAVSYEGAAATAIRLLKYQRKIVLARSLGALLLPLLGEMDKVDGVAPVPLHIHRLREREFNQALALAQVVCRAAGWPLWWDLLERIRPTAAQVGLEAAERRRNVRRAFTVRRPKQVEGKTVVLIDDVLTTGSTVNECARVLRRSGAAAVRVLTVARQL